MAKLLWFRMFPGDWFKDRELRMCSAATRGIWIDLLLTMKDGNGDGSLTGTVEQLARISGVTAGEMQCAINELADTRAADVTLRDGKVTVVNRRTRRECDAGVTWRDAGERARELHKNRQDRYRKRQKSVTRDAGVTLRDARVTPTDTDTDTDTEEESGCCAAAKEEAAAAAAADSPVAQFSKAATLIRQSFPGTDQALIADIVARALERKPDASDEDVTAALVRTHKGTQQRSAALWKQTVPAYLDGLARANPPPGEVCPVCDGKGEIFQPEFEGQPNSAWLNLPHGRVFAACPRCRGAPKKPNGQVKNGKEESA